MVSWVLFAFTNWVFLCRHLQFGKYNLLTYLKNISHYLRLKSLYFLLLSILLCLSSSIYLIHHLSTLVTSKPSYFPLLHSSTSQPESHRDHHHLYCHLFTVYHQRTEDNWLVWICDFLICHARFFSPHVLIPSPSRPPSHRLSPFTHTYNNNLRENRCANSRRIHVCLGKCPPHRIGFL